MPDLEGFYLYLVVNSKSKQTKRLKFAIGRLAREHPTADPRKVLLEWLAERITEYEQSIRR